MYQYQFEITEVDPREDIRFQRSGKIEIQARTLGDALQQVDALMTAQRITHWLVQRIEVEGVCFRATIRPDHHWSQHKYNWSTSVGEALTA